MPPAACLPGYFGPKCLTQCPQNRFGEKCGGVCSPGCFNDMCHHVYGCLHNKTTILQVTGKYKTLVWTSFNEKKRIQIVK